MMRGLSREGGPHHAEILSLRATVTQTLTIRDQMIRPGGLAGLPTAAFLFRLVKAARKRRAGSR